MFHQACGKRIVDIFGKIRKKGEKPSWMGEKDYAYLLERWQTEEFKKLSQQNKTNRASTRGGAVHTTGRRAHHDVALELVCILFVITICAKIFISDIHFNHIYVVFIYRRRS